VRLAASHSPRHFSKSLPHQLMLLTAVSCLPGRRHFRRVARSQPPKKIWDSWHNPPAYVATISWPDHGRASRGANPAGSYSKNGGLIMNHIFAHPGLSKRRLFASREEPRQLCVLHMPRRVPSKDIRIPTKHSTADRVRFGEFNASRDGNRIARPDY
jgi:hypothetical protein